MSQNLQDPQQIVSDKHTDRYGIKGTYAFASGRVNLIGEYTDFNQGLVLPMPLPQGIGIMISDNDNAKICIQSTEFNDEVIRDLDEKASSHWSDYLLGSIQAAGMTFGEGAGLDITVSSTLPVGAAVSSSAAVCVAMLRALRKKFTLGYNDTELAKIAQSVENNYVGVMCGLMDQMVISVGQQGSALLFDVQSGETTNYPLIPSTALLTIHSGQSRTLKDNAYNERREACERACVDMAVESLREASLADLVKVSSEQDRRKAHHVITENQRVLDAVAALKSGDAAVFGEIMYQCHQSLSEDFLVSTPLMDEMVGFAKGLGATGARMTGGGFGGCVVVLVRAGEEDILTEKLLTSCPDAWLVSRMDFSEVP